MNQSKQHCPYKKPHRFIQRYEPQCRNTDFVSEKGPRNDIDCIANITPQNKVDKPHQKNSLMDFRIFIPIRGYFFKRTPQTTDTMSP